MDPETAGNFGILRLFVVSILMPHHKKKATATQQHMLPWCEAKFSDIARWDQVHSRGLPTDEGPSTVYVEFDTPDDETEISKDVAKVRQMVPVDFLPGAFFCSVTGRQSAAGSIWL